MPHSGSPSIQSIPPRSRRSVRVTSPTYPALPERRPHFLGLQEERRSLRSQRYPTPTLCDPCSRHRGPRIRYPMALFLDDLLRPLDSMPTLPAANKTCALPTKISVLESIFWFFAAVSRKATDILLENGSVEAPHNFLAPRERWAMACYDRRSKGSISDCGHRLCSSFSEPASGGPAPNDCFQ